MARHIVLLRGVNLGSRNRVSMRALRDALVGAGFDDVATYLQSGNVVLSSTKSSDEVRRTCERVLARKLGLEVEVVTRTAAQLAKIVERNPLGRVATDPKRYQVSFLDGRLPAAARRRLEAAAAAQERFEVSGREVYAWHPRGVARSRLWTLLAGRDLGVTATSRNWTTVTKLLELV